MKEFMLIFIGPNYTTMGLSPEEMQAQMGKWRTWHAEMEAEGVVRSGHALHDSSRSVTGPQRAITDRTATELKELVGGYYVIAAKDIEDATRIAQGYPDYDNGGTVEIREIMVFEQ